MLIIYTLFTFCCLYQQILIRVSTPVTEKFASKTEIFKYIQNKMPNKAEFCPFQLQFTIFT